MARIGAARRARPRIGHIVLSLLTALLAAVTAVAVAAPAGAATTAPAKAPVGKAAPPTRAGCAAPNRPDLARCFALIRADINRQAVHPQDTPNGYGPPDLQSAYQLPSSTAGAGQTVALVDAFDAPTAEADLGVYRSQFGLPACTTDNGCFRKVNQDGEAGPVPPVDAGWATEISLDLDMVSAACPNCSILLVEADDNSIDNLAASVNTAVSLGAKYVSNSYGAGEDPSEVGYDGFYNHPGVAVTASTGDSGFGTSYPATAPGVTAVGGTSLTSDTSARGWAESAWDGAGSGCSDVEPKPSFQTDPDCDGRSIADVSADADPATGVAVYDSTPFDGGAGWQVYGGTSASSPLIAATYALAGTPGSGTDPESYPYQNPDQLNDVTTGSNGSCDGSYLCTAAPGYDGPTGLGTPNGVNAFRVGPHGTLTGTVTKSGGTTPVSGAKITAGDSSTVTSADGSYTLSVPAGTYTVTASAFGFKSASRDGVVVADQSTVSEDFALTAVPSVTLSGNVTDGSGHSWPLYAKITVAGVPGGPVYTDPFTGHYELNLPSQNDYTLKVEPVYPGYTTPTVPVTLGTHNTVQNIAVPVADSCTAPGYTTKFTGTVEHFDADTIPATWTVKDNDGSGGVWVANDPGGRGNLTGGTGNFAIIDSDHLGVGATQDTELISPVVDLSDQDAPVVGVNSDYKSFLASTADIDYTVDGGATWTNVWEATDTDQQGPLQIALPGAAHQSAVQVRFHYTGAFDFYWEVDDVFVGTKSCVTTPGGLVAGFTKDDNTKQPLVGVTVSSDDVPADSGVSAATPDDAARPDGFYWLFSSATGNHKFTASKAHYTAVKKQINVATDFVTRKDFVLGAGQVAVTPSGLAATVTLGGSATRSFTVTNTGTVAAHVKLAEQGGAFQIAGRPAPAAYRHDTGAPVQHVRGHYSPLRAEANRTSTKPANVRPADAPWQAIADYPTPISNNAASFQGGKVYSVGGFDGTDDVASAYSYDPDAGTWAQLADMSTTREAPTSAWLNGKLYVTGGWGPDAAPLGSTEVYDPGADSWTAVADNPAPHAGASAAVLNGQLYVIGGCGSASCGSTDVEVYDPSADSWSSGTAYPGQTAWESCGGIADQIFCAGGTTDAGTSAKTYAFDGSTWTAMADLPTDDWGAAYSVANGQLLVSGGVIQNSAMVTNEGWSYDPSADAWSTLPNSNNALYRLGGACGFYKIGGSVSAFEPASTAAEVLPGYDDCDSGADVPWLAETPTEFDVAPGASAQVTVTMDSAALTQPGTYSAAITLSTDTPYQVSPVQVTFTVNPPKTWGKISGVVTGQPCSGSAAPLAGATVQINSWAASYTLSTDKDGKYALWLDKRNNPLTLIVAKDGWAPQTTTAKVKPGSPLVDNFTLKPAKACK